jgi:hypothetical protein
MIKPWLAQRSHTSKTALRMTVPDFLSETNVSHEATMNPPKPVILREAGNESPAPSLRSVVRKSALLNLVIVLTSCPILLTAGGPKAVYPTLAIMAAISIVIWTATFALFSFAVLPRLFCTRARNVVRHTPDPGSEESGVADRWLDGPSW